MSVNVVNSVAYLPTSRNFPEDLRQLTIEVNRAYVDIANTVNNRTVSIFPTTRSAINGESWIITGNQRQQGFRQVYTFTTLSAINHGINIKNAAQFIRCFGSYTNGTKTFGLIFGNIGTPIAGQVVFDITSTQIEFAAGAGAPAVTNGTIVLEWISPP